MVAENVDEFQSAPRSGERGDVEKLRWTYDGIMFQSAPRSGERGDYGNAIKCAHRGCFNPRPARVSGATAPARLVDRALQVSIRAPLG